MTAARNLAFALACIQLGACSQTISPHFATTETVAVQDQSFVFGQTNTAFVGQPIVRVSDCFLETRRFDGFEATQRVTLEGQELKDAGWAEGDILIPVGTTVYDGIEYFVVPISNYGRAPRFVLVDSKGSILNKNLFISEGFGALPLSHNVLPVGARLSPIKIDDPSNPPRGTGIKYEIIYSGTNGLEINLLYREYTPTESCATNLLPRTNLPSERHKDPIQKPSV